MFRLLELMRLKCFLGMASLGLLLLSVFLESMLLFIIFSSMPFFPLFLPILVLIDVVIFLGVSPLFFVINILPSVFLMTLVFVPIIP